MKFKILWDTLFAGGISFATGTITSIGIGEIFDNGNSEEIEPCTE